MRLSRLFYLRLARQHPPVELVNHPRHVGPRLAIRRNAVVPVHRLRSGVIRSQRQRQIVVIAGQQFVQISCPPRTFSSGLKRSSTP